VFVRSLGSATLPDAADGINTGSGECCGEVFQVEKVIGRISLGKDRPAGSIDPAGLLDLLNLPRRGFERRAGCAGLESNCYFPNLPKICIGEGSIRLTEVGEVEDVADFASELDLNPFVNGEVAEERGVYVSSAEPV
jgi:hypothetical protein